jgi:hypothetical protein
MPIVGIGQLDDGDQASIARHQAITDVAVHQFAGSLQCRTVSERLVAHQRIDPFPMNISRPPRFEDVGDGEL